MGDVLDFKKPNTKFNVFDPNYADMHITVDGISYEGTILSSLIVERLEEKEAEKDYMNELEAKNKQMNDFIRSLLNPDAFGLAVSAEVRDEARYVLGMKKVETV